MRGDDGFTFVAAETDSDKRLDSLIAEKLPQCSRTLAASIIRNGSVRVSGAKKKPGYHVRPGDVIQGTIPAPEPMTLSAEPLPIQILFEDADIIVLNKAPGVVVHPAPGNYTGTLVNGLMFHCPEIEGVGGKTRPGIVHRLDKDTSGVLLVAKNHFAHTALSLQFQERSVEKKYLALVYGRLKQQSGTINLPIGRHPTQRKKMSIRSRNPRDASTVWRVKQQYEGLALLEISLLTGRTHQIRVHCNAIHHPIVGDPVYGAGSANRRIRQIGEGGEQISAVTRQMLHSWRLSVAHPKTGASMTFEAPLPDDMRTLLAWLDKNNTG